MAENEEETLHCSFCGKSQHEVRKLIAASSAWICNECVQLCLDILIDEGFSFDVLGRYVQNSEFTRSLHKLVSEVDAILSREKPYIAMLNELDENAGKIKVFLADMETDAVGSKMGGVAHLDQVKSGKS